MIISFDNIYNIDDVVDVHDSKINVGNSPTYIDTKVVSTTITGIYVEITKEYGTTIGYITSVGKRTENAIIGFKK